MASSTRRRVGSATMSGRIQDIRDCPQETPASAATSFMLTVALRAAMRSLTPGPELKFWARVPAICRMPEEIAALNYTPGGLSHPMLATLAATCCSLGRVARRHHDQTRQYLVDQQWRGAKLPSIVTVPGCSTTSRPPILGWSHAATGGGQVAGPMQANEVFTRLGHRHREETASRWTTFAGREMTGCGSVTA